MPSIGKRIGRMIGGSTSRSRNRFRVPTGLVITLVVLFTAFIVGGGIYDLMEKPPAIISLSIISSSLSGYTAVRGFNDEQTLTESVLSMLFNILVFAGLFVSYRSTQIIYDSRRATTTLIIGIALFGVGLAGSFYIFNLKQLVLNEFGGSI